jgi:hypothetical protein
MNKSLLTKCIIFISALILTFAFSGCGKEKETVKLSDNQKIVEGIVTDVYDDEEGAYVTIKTDEGEFIIDCQKKSFEKPIENNDLVRVIVEDMRTQNGSSVGNLTSIIEHTKSK